MNVTVTDQEQYMTILCPLTQSSELLIAANDTIVKDSKITLEFVKSPSVQEEKSMNSGIAEFTENYSDLLCTRSSNCGSGSIPICTYCNKRGHLEKEWWIKYPYLNPEQVGFIVMSKSDTTKEVDQICLVATTPLLYALHCSCVIQSIDTLHMTYNEAVFSKMETVNLFVIGISHLSSVKGCRRGTVHLMLPWMETMSNEFCKMFCMRQLLATTSFPLVWWIEGKLLFCLTKSKA